ncbi:1633_t:CDS:2, partial [Cetraspora pellucida]
NPVLPGLSLNFMFPVLPEPLLPLDPVLLELSLNHMSPVLLGLSLNVMSTLFSIPIDINSPVDFLLSPVTNFSNDHQPSEQEFLIENNNIDNGIIIDTDLEKTPRFRKLMLEMLSNIEKYVIQGRMDSGSIYPLLKHDYPNNPIFKKDLYNAVYQFQATNNPGDSDASQMLQMLLSWKEFDPLWVARWSHLVNQYPEVAKYMSETLYVNKKLWVILWIHNQFTAVNINNYVKNEEHFERFEVEHSALLIVGLLTLNTMLFRQIDDIMKKFLTPIMLDKQHLQMNQS